MKKQISKPARERLIQLLRLLDQLEGSGEKALITSGEIEMLTGWTDVTVRRDISLLSANSATSSGYSIATLRTAIEDALSINRGERACCIVGLGRLGSALLEYEGLSSSSFVLKAGFDISKNRCETLRSSIPLYSTLRMERVIRDERIEFAILAVPEAVAQEVVDKLCEYGIKGIVNFTSRVLQVQETVSVQSLSVLDALQNLSSIV
ncbi:MAG TPA: redox-sensing transcriptional repressor Rex [Treponemataceae bacterium]|nr:redox-sensing transcriptional repressor Rex [Treponemataceae bacterium]